MRPHGGLKQHVDGVAVEVELETALGICLMTLKTTDDHDDVEVDMSLNLCLIVGYSVGVATDGGAIVAAASEQPIAPDLVVLCTDQVTLYFLIQA
jgi:hypothetical protein